MLSQNMHTVQLANVSKNQCAILLIFIARIWLSLEIVTLKYLSSSANIHLFTEGESLTLFDISTKCFRFP